MTSSTEGNGGDHTTRVLLLGTSGIGKTSLARTLTSGAFPTAAFLKDSVDPQSTLTPRFKFKTTPQTSIKVTGMCHHLEVVEKVAPVDEAMNVSAEDLREIDIVFLCFDISNPTSFDDVRVTWLPQLRKSLGSKSDEMPTVVLVGLKEDLGKDAGVLAELASANLRPITYADASVLANEVQAQSYVEVSALKTIGIEKLKEEAVFCTKNRRQIAVAEKQNCGIL